ncbi:aspartate/tyrosine/aromatic aminotransferase [soil metagenome]
MFEALKPQPADKIIELIGLFAADPREAKVDLGVGVYRDREGRTPVMRAVKAAERRLLETQSTKSYVGLLGDEGFLAAMRGLILGEAAPPSRIAGAQTPGGTGAVHLLLELVKLARPDATIWYSEPTWPNHPAIIAHLGLKARTYAYFDAATRAVDVAGMTDDLSAVAAGDVVLLHGCCHNPTGANLSLPDWQALTDLIGARGAVAMIDLAYQGFGDGIEADVAGVRHMAAVLPETLIAASCSKNFGLYRERVGAAFAVMADGETATVAKGALAALNRLNYSFPPDHGAKVVEIILGDPTLRADWQGELDEMRANMLALRRGLAEALRRETNSDRFDFIAEHRGMFSRLGASPEQVQRLRDEHGIYLVGDSRINVAGLPAEGLDRLARALVAVGI